MEGTETAENDADTLYKLLMEKGSEDEFIKFICKKTNAQRLEIRKAFISQYGQELSEYIDSKLSGNFKDCAIALFDSPIEYDAKQINKAVKGLGTDDDALIELIGSRPPWRFEAIKEKYNEIIKKDLIKDVEDDTSGVYRNLLVALLQGGRSENPYPNEKQCIKYAEELFEAGEKTRGTEEDIFVKHFAMRSPAELAMIAYYYECNHSNSLLKAIDKELSGDMKKLLNTIFTSLTNPTEYFARRVNKAIDGMGTNNNMLIRVLVSRCEIDMPQIRSCYKKLFNKEMIDDIKGDTSGDYQNLLVELASR